MSTLICYFLQLYFIIIVWYTSLHTKYSISWRLRLVYIKTYNKEFDFPKCRLLIKGFFRKISF